MVSSSKVEYVASGQLIAASYVKNAKAIGFLWAIFSVCYAIINMVVFFQPQWIGSREPSTSGFYGLWKYCQLSSIVTESNTQTEFLCRGRLDDFSSLINPAFRASTAFIGISTIISMLSVFALILFLCAPPTVAYSIVSWMQTFSAICTGVGLIIFPVGWDAPEVKMTCGPEAGRFNLGLCSMRWAFVLAIIGLLDGIVLAILGFVLGSRHIKLTDEGPRGQLRKPYGLPNGSSIYGSYARGGCGGFYHQRMSESQPTPSVTNYSYASTKRSMNLQPIVLLPPDSMADGYSEYGRSKHSLYKSEYATPSQNFQL